MGMRNASLVQETLHDLIASGRATPKRMEGLADHVGDTDERGMTPLHVAASLGLAPVVCRLLRAGSDVDSKDRNGNTPLHHAAYSDSHDAVTALLRAGASSDARNALGLRPIDIAPEGRVLPGGKVVRCARLALLRIGMSRGGSIETVAITPPERGGEPGLSRSESAVVVTCFLTE